MDILNFISWIRGGRRVTTVDPDKTLVPIGIKDSRRDDGYLSAAITITDLANYICGGGGTVQLVIGDLELPPYPITGVELVTRCSGEPPYQNLTYSVFGIPSETISTYLDLLNWLNTNFNYPGYTWIQTGPTTIEVILDLSLLTGDCPNPNQVFLNFIGEP